MMVRLPRFFTEKDSGSLSSTSVQEYNSPKEMRPTNDALFLPRVTHRATLLPMFRITVS
ncbi:unnamed protein product [Acanthoscelides obtectus]|uniref:Uncharacterized protein n=1 Tax=Acanthoscelides obtectus TaxID=200917 RepID=A0A9P0JVV8_ACAOB|nr:unnamed protein product [Acanthoscelides obtectus]CAK1647016.1 hypothetical protein AOBTE_LOCUS15002 [Acanthoscelides obtectus]